MARSPAHTKVDRMVT